MYLHTNHIPQPPHSAGLNYQGLRPRIDPAQVPSPIAVTEIDRQSWESKTFMTLPGTYVPLCTTDFIAVDQGNSSPKFVRVSTWKMPSTSRLASDCKIPLAAVFQPFSELDPREEPIPVVDLGNMGPPRCQRCRGYINPWCTWVAGGVKWKCNLCSHETEVPSDYFCNLDANLLRLDLMERPELTKGTVDFSVHSSEEYWGKNPPPQISMPYHSVEPPPTGSRRPEPMDIIFAFDVSSDAVASGFLECACATLKDLLYAGEGDLNDACFSHNGRMTIITFDTTLHFYDLTSDLTPTLVVADLDEVFVPIKDGLFVKPVERRSAIETLLDSIPNRFSSFPSVDSAFGSVVVAGLAALVGRGGHLIVFQSTLPTIGYGALPSLQPTSVNESSTDSEPIFHKPRSPAWPSLGADCALQGIGVTLFLAPSRFIDIASISTVASRTGGDIFFHPRFERIRDGDVLKGQLRRVLKRTQGYDCMMRVRCSKGLQTDKYYGSFHFQNQSPPELALGILDCDKAISVSLSHTHKLDPRSYAFLQSAVLYTTVDGERRVRVCNLALNVAELAGNVFQYAEFETTVCHMAREAMSAMSVEQTLSIRESLTEKCAAILLGYRTFCAANTRSTQLIIPEAFLPLPAYTLALQKSKPLKARQVSPDVRNYYIHRMLSMSPRDLVYCLYPRLLALHDLDDQIALPFAVEDNVDGGNDEALRTQAQMQQTPISMPSCMRNGHLFMEAGGIYLIDNAEVVIFWIGSSVSPQLLLDLFGTEDINALNPYTATRTPNPSYQAFQPAQRGWPGKMYIARQNLDAAEIEFSDMLVEDQNNGAMSYTDYLAVVHHQIAVVLNNGGSVGGGGKTMRGSAW
ncbi:sec24-related protein [Phlegmacium glaucopus]|nr:sec24-related protein [Phlegmacium glaucopus]